MGTKGRKNVKKPKQAKAAKGVTKKYGARTKTLVLSAVKAPISKIVGQQKLKLLRNKTDKCAIAPDKKEPKFFVFRTLGANFQLAWFGSNPHVWNKVYKTWDKAAYHGSTR
jgi:hypothetical protein